MTMGINSYAFENDSEIPFRYTCDGEDISPPLTWSGIPTRTKSLVLIMDDPDAPDPENPQKTWVHWVLYNISPTVEGLVEDITELPAKVREGLNDWKRTGYGGPCPPIGKHRYFFKLYALNIELPILENPTKDKIEAEMKEHVLEMASLIGTYQRAK